MIHRNPLESAVIVPKVARTLIDARGDNLRFAILEFQPDSYVNASQVGDWTTSRVFQHQFRLERTRDRIGGWQYTLGVQQSS